MTTDIAKELADVLRKARHAVEQRASAEARSNLVLKGVARLTRWSDTLASVDAALARYDALRSQPAWDSRAKHTPPDGGSPEEEDDPPALKHARAG